MKVYLAARWSRRAELEGYADQLRERGIEVTSRWLTLPSHRIVQVVEHGDGSAEERQAFNAELAQHDYDDVQAADALILFTDGSSGARGGCYVEFGLAMAWGKELVVVGEQTNVFTFRPEIALFETWDSFLAALNTFASVPS